MKTPMTKFAAIAAIAAFTISAPFASAFGVGMGGSCRYYLHVKNCWGWYYTGDNVDVTLEVYKINRDSNGNPTGLGAKATTSVIKQTALGSTGYNYILEVVGTSDSSSDTNPVPGEQLALVVKNGSKEVWRSYTALPPWAWMSVSVNGFEVSGIFDSSYSDEDGDGLHDEWLEAVNMYADAYGVDLVESAGGDSDGDGLTNLQEFMCGTDPIGGALEEYFPVNTITLKNWSADETTRKATVTIDGSDSHAYSIRYTTDLAKTGRVIDFSTTDGGSESTKYIYHDVDNDPGAFSQQVWFTLPDPSEVGSYYVGIAVDGVLAVYTQIAAPAATTYTITWLDSDGTELGTTEVAEGEMPEHADPTKTDDSVYTYTFTDWTPALEEAVSNTTYTATYSKVVDLSTLTKDYTAVDGDVIVDSTTYAVIIPANASVTVNGVTIKGASGTTVDDPSFSESGESAITKFKQVSDGVWTVTAFAEMDNESRGTDVKDSQIKVYAAGSLEDLKAAEPLTSSDYTVEKKSAVKTTINVTVPGTPEKQFFKVEFGE